MEAKLLTGQFFMERIMPETRDTSGARARGSHSMMAVPAEMF